MKNKSFKDPKVDEFFRLSTVPGFKVVKVGYKKLKLQMCLITPLCLGGKETWLDISELYYGNAIPQVADLWERR